ncbi:ArdC family protein [Novosphingobium sp. FSW06-99]|uniref:ArdC family protein n=1 Tax=Novosphingobium sp. FSW06-99 TaxID=1739113 RepID=UPI00076D11F5|nr:zincin-like metallopeptidase domain-containing protein [Novosphingobium sp. FSW06-99]KUR78640.1 antirepressor [Novosphingobium sp. FSW06-99]
MEELYDRVTRRIVAELEEGRLPWVQPWNSATVLAGLPCNAVSGRAYSGINILILWHALFEGGFAAQRWLTFRQAEALGGHVRRGERGVTVCYADRFTPKDAQNGEGGTPASDGEAVRQVAFLKRFTVFNVAQCEGLPDALTLPEGDTPRGDAVTVPEAEALVAASGARVCIGAPHACYVPSADRVEVPLPRAFGEPINFYRTVLHELGHWTGHPTRLDRDQSGRFGSAAYAREELVAELCSAFACAAMGIVPTVRHADYIGAWLEVLRADNRAIFRAASQASKAADYLLAFRPQASAPEAVP